MHLPPVCVPTLSRNMRHTGLFRIACLPSACPLQNPAGTHETVKRPLLAREVPVTNPLPSPPPHYTRARGGGGGLLGSTMGVTSFAGNQLLHLTKAWKPQACVTTLQLADLCMRGCCSS